jgi:hypothetical protein
MSKTNLFSFLSVAALSFGLSIPAGATTVTVEHGVLTSSTGLPTADFSTGVLPSNFTDSSFSAGLVTGTSPFFYIAPVGISGYYGWVDEGGFMTETFSSPVNYFGLDWGTPDQYNSLTFTDTMGNTITYVASGAGIQIPGLTPLVYGNADAYVNFYDTGNDWVSVTWGSNPEAFEFANVTAGMLTMSPEPTSVALLAGGLLVIGGALRRRNKR